jgi:hypothetical protein
MDMQTRETHAIVLQKIGEDKKTIVGGRKDVVSRYQPIKDVSP